MMDMFSDAVPWLQAGYWAAPVIGLVVCGLAFFMGRRFLAAPPALAPPESAAPLDSALKGLNQDRRVAPRRKGNTVEVQLSDGSDAPPQRGWVLDRSIGGLCLLVDQTIAPGTALRVRPAKASTTTPWANITVRSCRPDGGQYELGCQFDQMPTWNLLLLFG